CAGFDLAGDDPDLRGHSGGRRRDAGRQPATAPRRDDRLDIRHLLEDLETANTLPGNHIRVAVGMYEEPGGALVSTMAEDVDPLHDRQFDDARAVSDGVVDLGARGSI